MPSSGGRLRGAPPEVPLEQAGQAARASDRVRRAAIGDGASLCGIGWTGFGAGCTRGCTLGFAMGFGGTGLGGVGVDCDRDWRCHRRRPALNNCAVIARTSTGRGSGSFRIVTRTVSKIA